MRRRAAVRTLGQQVWVWSVRALLNLLVCGLLGAAFYGVYWATGASVQLQVRREAWGRLAVSPCPRVDAPPPAS